MHRRGTLCAALVLACLPALAGAPSAEDLRYELPLPAGQRVKYAIEFLVAYPGRLEVIGEWAGNRVLSFRVEEVDVEEQPFRRSGPSPQVLAFDVPNPGDIPRHYRLQIRGLASREGTSGTVTIRRPQPPPAPLPQLEKLPPTRPPEAPVAELPTGVPDALERFSLATDRFADAVARDPRGDACRWQKGLAGFLTRRRDDLLAGAYPPAPETLRTLEEIASLVRRVDELRTSKDPTLAGPPPASATEYRRWSEIRDDRIGDVESELDDLLAGIERGYAPELNESPWSYRLVSCVIGCERYFEERVRVGDRAVNRDLARAQWDRLLEASELLDFLTRLSPQP